MSANRRYDVYDDTGRNSRPTRARASSRARDRMTRRRSARQRPDTMSSLFEQFDRDMATFHNSFFPVVFGGPNGEIDRHFGGGTYMYESHTSTMGPDGRMTTETIRTRPGRDGRPETQRIHRDATGRETRSTTSEMPPHPFDDFGWPFTSAAAALPPSSGAVEVRDITDEDEGRRRRSRRHRHSMHEPRIVVEEPDDEDSPRVRRSTSHHRQPRKSFFERTFDNWRRDGRA